MRQARYPELFREVVWPWGPTRAKFELHSEPPPSELIANVNVVPRLGDRWVIIRVGDEWDIIGGTLEPSEGYLETIRREAMEEAGAQLLSFRLFGAWECHALGKPYRPHLPYPKFYRVVGLGEVELHTEPTNPLGGENVTAVEAVSLDTAVARLASSGDQHFLALAELYQLASQLPGAFQFRGNPLSDRVLAVGTPCQNAREDAGLEQTRPQREMHPQLPQ